MPPSSSILTMIDTELLVTSLFLSLVRLYAGRIELIIVSISLLLLVVYVQICRYLKSASWMDLIKKYSEPTQIEYGKNNRFRDITTSLKTGQGEASDAVVGRFENLYFHFTFGIVYPILLTELLCFRLPLYLGRMAWAKYKHGHYASHSEQDVVDCLLTCPSLYIMCEAVDKETISSIISSHNASNSLESNDLLRQYLDDGDPAGLGDDQAWMFELPKELPGHALSGDLQIRHATIIFLQRHRRILFASHLGSALDINASTANSTNLNLLFTLAQSTIITWVHVQTHMMCEMSAEEIARGGIDILEPSARFVDSLHEGLLNSPRSPIVEGHKFSAISVTRDTLEARLLHQTPHYLDARKKEFPGYTFLLQARSAIGRRLKEFDLSKAVTLELLFQNMVFHSIDHYLTHAFLSRRPHSIDGSESFRSYIQSFIVYAFWTESKVNMFDDNRLRAVAKTNHFYQKVYKDLKRCDAFLSDKVVVSCAF